MGQYIDSSKPAIDRMARLDALPTWVCFAPGVADILDELVALLRDGLGAFITVDYGGTAHHVFDNASSYPHLRTFSRELDADPNGPRRDEYANKVHNPFRAPGCEDLTYDLDFTWATEYLEKSGLRVAFYGNQGALEAPVDLWKQPYQKQLVAGRIKEGFAEMEALMRAHTLLKRFRQGSGFRLFAVTSPGLPELFSELGAPDPVRYSELPSVPTDFDWDRFRVQLVDLLVEDGWVEKDALVTAQQCCRVLHPTGGVIEDLDDAGLYGWRGQVLSAL